MTIDTVRATDCSVYGSPEITTPHLDALSRNGLVVERAYASCDLTNPSHATLLTGLPLAAHGSYTLRSPIPASVETLGELLSARGYATAAVVSVHHLTGEMSGLAQGFGSFDAPRVEAPDRASEDSLPIFAGALAGLPPLFFTWLHLYDPHMPYSPPPPWSALAPEADPRSLPTVPSLAELERTAHVPFPYRDWLATQDLAALPARYRAEIAQADFGAARAVALTRKKAPDAVIAVTADHGEGFGEHAIWWNHFGLYEEMVRVPLVVAAPGRVSPGILLRHTFPAADLCSRLTALCEGARWSSAPETPALLEMRNHLGSGIARGDTKLLDQRPGATPLRPGIHLYDLTNDPGERVDLAAQDDGTRNQLAAELAHLVDDARRHGHGEAPAIDPGKEALEKLKGLGYVDP